MSRYKCEYCEEINTNESWNEATIARFGEDSFILEESEYDAVFICPSCHATCTDKLMTNIEEEEYLCSVKTTTNHIIKKILFAESYTQANEFFRKYLYSNFISCLCVEVVKLSDIERI